MATDALLLGRVTYEVSRGLAVATEVRGRVQLDAKTSSPARTSRVEQLSVLEGDLRPASQAEALTDVVVHGSGLVRTLLGDLVDEPADLPWFARGMRLFGETAERKRLQLVDTRTVGDGVLILTYARPTGATA
jgi:hypothetical protein